MKTKLLTLFLALAASVGTIFAEVYKIDLSTGSDSLQLIHSATPIFADSTLTIEYTINEEWGEAGIAFLIPSEIALNLTASPIVLLDFDYKGVHADDFIPYIRDSEGNRWWDENYAWTSHDEWSSVTGVSPTKVLWSSCTYDFRDKPLSAIGFIVISEHPNTGSFAIRNVKIRYGHNCIINAESNDSHMGSFSGQGTYLSGTQVSLSANPYHGYHFVKWSDGVTDNPRTIILTQDTTFTAEFAKNEYSIATLSANPEWGTTSGDTTAFYWDTVQIFATSTSGYHFTQWNDGNTDNPRTITVTGNGTYTATFAKNIYNIDKQTKSEEGSISGNSQAEYLDYVTLTAVPNRGFYFSHWSDGSTENPRTIELTQDTTMVAIFDYLLEGKCGKDSLLTWTLDTTTFALDISGQGALSENYTYGTFIQSLTIGDEVTSIGQSAFAGCNNLRDVVLGTSVKVLEEYAFYGCSAIETITCYSQRPPTVNNYALYGLDYSTVVFVPADYLNNYLMHDAWGLYDVRPLGALSQYSVTTIPSNPEWGTTIGDTTVLYKSRVEITAVPKYGYHFVQWNDGVDTNPRTVVVTQNMSFTAEFAKNKYSITKVANPEYGSISGPSQGEYLDNITLEAIPVANYQLAQWSDGVKTNPRTFVLTQDTTLTAEFEIATSGRCGDNNQLIWKFDTESHTLTISGRGKLNSNYTFGLQAPTQTERLVIEEGVTSIGNAAFRDMCQAFTFIAFPTTVTSIGDSAFMGMNSRQLNKLILPIGLRTIGKHAFDGASYLQTIDFGASLELIKESAFNGCGRVKNMTCLAAITPDVETDGLTSISSNAELYVLDEYLLDYQVDNNWNRFLLKVIGATETTTEEKEVTVEPSDNEATFTWPTENNAASYTIQISKDGELFCTLIFNANGQLIGIAFAPSRNGSSHAPSATMTANGMQFTVTGLNVATRYGYDLTAKDDNSNILAKYTGTFGTTGAPQSIEDVESTSIPVKVLRDGQVLILRGEKTYTVTGQEIR